MCEVGVCSDSQAKKFVAALTLPFNKNAIGAQFPDSYSFPTDTRFIKTDLKLYSDADGNLDFTLLPSLFQSILTGRGNAGTALNDNTSINAIGTDSTFQVSSFITPPIAASDGTFNLGGVTIPGLINAQLQQYRIVGWGARIRALIAPINQAGRLIFCSSPSNEMSLYEPNNNTAIGTVNYNDVLNFFKLPTAGLDGFLTTEILNVPDAMECMFSDLSLSGGMQWVSKCTSPDALSFRSTNNTLVDGANSLGFGLTDGSSSGSVFTTAPGLQPNACTSASTVNPTNTVNDNTVISIAPVMTHCKPQAFSGITNQVWFNMGTSGLLPVASCIEVREWFGPIPQVNFVAYCGDPDQIPTISATDLYSNLNANVTTNNLNYPGLDKVSQVRWYSADTSSGLMRGWLITCQTNYDSASMASSNLNLLFLPFYDNSPGTGAGYQGTVLYGANNTAPSATNGGYIPVPIQNFVDAGSVPGLTVVDPDFVQTKGWSQMSCRGFGLTPSQPVLSCEIVYHIEGPPLISGLYGSVSSGGQYPYVDKALMDEALEYAAKKPHFQIIAGGRSGSALTNMALN